MTMKNNIPQWGTPAPWFHGHTLYNSKFAFSSLGGRFVALVFLGDFSSPVATEFIDHVSEKCPSFSDEHVVLFAVTLKQQDQYHVQGLKAFPKQRIFYDPNGYISEQYGVIDNSKNQYHPVWLILDPTLRVYATGSILEPEQFIHQLKQLPHPAMHADNHIEPWAPVLLVPRILEPETCKKLIHYYRSGKPDPSGFMRTVNGKTTALQDPNVKRRNDITIEDSHLRDHIKHKIRTRLVPEINKAFQFNATRIERYIVASYKSQDKGFFKEHRDNTTKGTAHRRFAVSINLNSDEYEGGELWFPEYGCRKYKPPTGGAIVFSCSLMHAATPVTTGERFVVLPFLYDDAAAKIREENNKYLDQGVEAYRQDSD
ncbi:2OG-Fe(II) oxygenase [Endozoicomonas sp. Mp262]|uniref:2OG-Fe(II) oxygenase n=1 Tax=Endozoicomonas sp. Mp262 TaxID=2919499 RepID=UPI0021D9A349